MSDIATIDATTVEPLTRWAEAVVDSLPALGGMLGLETSTGEALPVSGPVLGNYIYLYGDEHAFQIGLVGAAADFIALTRALVGADDDEPLDNEDVFDGVGEIVNILVGNIKTKVGPAFEHLAIGLPMTVEGSIVFPRPEARKTVGVRFGRIPASIIIDMHPLPAEVRRQRALEQAVREREARLKSILDTAPDAIVTLDAAGRVEAANPAAVKIFALSQEQLLGQPASVLLPELDRHVASLPVCDGEVHETVGQHPDGTRFPIEVSCSRLNSGEPSDAVLIARDISSRRVLEEELNNAQRLDAIGQLAAGIAHEINTPIQYVGDNAEFLKDAFRDVMSLLAQYGALEKCVAAGEDPGAILSKITAVEEELDLPFLEEEIPGAISQALEGVSRVANIVAAMKAFSHPGKDKESADLNAALKTTITVCRNEWKYVADLVTELDPALPMVSCVVGEINQVVLNIIVNAAHAIGAHRAPTDPKGTITVSTAAREGGAEIRIRDTGGGIPKAIQAKVFEPFFTTKEVGKGTGQGLNLARAIVAKKHNGVLFFETEEGVGTTFVIRLPI